jgi:methylmalonyl-CoA epimerase
MIKKIDHIAIGVNDLDAAIAFYTNILGLTASEPEIVESQKVKVVMVPVGEVKIELMSPTSEESPLFKSMAKRGEGIQHICFRVDDVNAQLVILSAAELPLLQKEPIKGAHNTLAFFLHPKAANAVLYEFNQKMES